MIRRGRLFPLVLLGSVSVVVLSSLPLLLYPAYDRFYYRVVVAHWVAGLALMPLYYYAFFTHVRSHLGSYRTALFVLFLVPITFLGGIGPPFVSPWHNPLSLPIAILTAVLYWMLRRRERRFFRIRLPPLRLLQSLDPTESRLSLWTGGGALLASWLMVHTGLALVLADFKFASDKYFLHGPVSIALLPLIAAHLIARRRKYGLRFTRSGRAVLAGLAVANLGLLGATLFKNLAPMEQLRPDKVTRVSTRPIEAGAVPALAAPTLALVDDSRPCQACHAEVAAAWSISSHRFAGLNRLYLKLIRQMADERGPESVRFCDNCHDPVLALAADPEKRFDPATLARSEGVSCKVCHFLEPAAEPAGNGVYALQLVEGLGFPEVTTRGLDIATFSMSQARLDARLHIRGVARRWYQEPDACRACHAVEIPAALNGAAGIEVSSLYASFGTWPHREETRCRECHMTNVDRGEADYRTWDHRFPGGNQALSLLVPEAYRDGARALDEYTDLALRGERPKGYDRDELRHSKARIVDLFWGGTLFPMEIEVEEEGDPAPSRGSRLALRIVTSNPKMGHDFPIDLQDQVDVWLEVRVTDGGGEQIFASGGLLADRHLAEGTRRLSGEFLDRNGKRITHHETWRLAEIRDRRVIPPGGALEERFVVPIPVEATRPFEITARWRLRRVNQEIADWLFDGDGTTFPITELSQAEQTVW